MNFSPLLKKGEQRVDYWYTSRGNPNRVEKDSTLTLANLADSRILVVDDQLANLRVLQTVLDIAGYQNVRCLNDSREVLPAVAEFSPDLIMLDLHMPHVDGLEVMDQLAQLIPQDDYVPVLVLTGDASSGAKEQALSRGAHDFLSKPLNRTEVQLRVKNLLQSRSLHLQLKTQNVSLEQQVRERNDLVEQLGRAKEEAERANHAKSEFLSRMSHELRTPLNAILGFAQLLEISAPRPEQLNWLGHIRKGGGHLLDLINEVLDVARIESGRVSVSLEPVDLPPVMSAAVDLIGPLASERRIGIRRDPADASEWRVMADQQRLKQVLLNLLSNAVKYNVENGRIDISCESRPGGVIRIAVSDTGPGISQESQARLFKPFERLQEEQTYIEGTGLGLSLCRGLMEAMGGRIGVESTPGKGSTFWIDLQEARRKHPSDLDALSRATAETPQPV
jgi:signal transduction histidine kinase